MNNTLSTICYSIQSDFKKTFADKDIPLSKIAFWVLTIANKLKAPHIEKMDSGMFIHIFPEVPIETYSSNTGEKDVVKGRPHIILPASIYDYDYDEGIEFIRFSAGNDPFAVRNGFVRTRSGGKAERLFMNPYEKPSLKNVYYYLAGRHVYFLGMEGTTNKTVEIGLKSAFEPVTDIDINQPFDFPEELLPVLIRQVLDLGRFVLMIPSERNIDGNDDTTKSQIPTQKLLSVNDQSAPQPEQ